MPEADNIPAYIDSISALAQEACAAVNTEYPRLQPCLQPKCQALVQQLWQDGRTKD